MEAEIQRTEQKREGKSKEREEDPTATERHKETGKANPLG